MNFGQGTGSSPLKSNRGSEGMMDARDLVESNTPPPDDDTSDVAFEAEESDVDVSGDVDVSNDDEQGGFFGGAWKKRKKGKKRKGGFLGGVFGRRRKRK